MHAKKSRLLSVLSGTDTIYSGTGFGFDFGKVLVPDPNQVPDLDHI
jgi:hypothetical protein